MYCTRRTARNPKPLFLAGHRGDGGSVYLLSLPPCEQAVPVDVLLIVIALYHLDLEEYVSISKYIQCNR